MRIRLVVILLLLALIGSAQNVTNVSFRQVGQKVEVTYTLDKTAPISLSVSTDGGKTFSAPLKHVSGDVGDRVTAGKKTIIWDALAEVDKIVGSQIVFRVTAKPIEPQTFTLNGVSFTMVYVQGGTFTMGATYEQGHDDYNEDEKPTHTVSLSSFFIGEAEVTQELWQAVMRNNPSYPTNIGDKNPVDGVSWQDCQVFIKTLNSLLSPKLNGKHFRLPTEAEWEYAARGGNKSRGFKYSGSNNIDEVAWYNGISNYITHPVKQKQPNELGLYDMSGNVREWCLDWYSDYSSISQSNPKGASRGSERIIRGGSYYCMSCYCHLSHRHTSPPNGSDFLTGFRLVLSE